MKLHDLKAIIDGLVDVHGGDMPITFKHKYGSGRTSQGPITGYDVRPPFDGSGGFVRFTINYARGEPE
jgi:hypothetical protein